MRTLNRLLRTFGVAVVPVTSGKMLIEHANVAEAHHPSRGGRTVAWMRQVADSMPYRHPTT